MAGRDTGGHLCNIDEVSFILHSTFCILPFLQRRPFFLDQLLGDHNDRVG